MSDKNPELFIRKLPLSVKHVKTLGSTIKATQPPWTTDCRLEFFQLETLKVKVTVHEDETGRLTEVEVRVMGYEE